ncbi:hypothetical protein [Streptomyces sp. NPDC020141]|uniref:hypothetical protein n=1 Tax=Streptomyces sp. NPDC020141 TaxID=3365065 RepID=UPI00379B69A0
MRIPKIASALIAPGLAIAVLGAGSPAAAVEPETPPAAETPIDPPIDTEPPASEEPGFEDLVDGEAVQGPDEPMPGGGRLPGRPCEPGWIWESTKRHSGKHHKGIGVTQSNYNETNQIGTSTFTSEASGEVGISVSGKVKAKASAMLAEIEAEYGVELSVKIAVKIGNRYSTPHPPKTVLNARYGAFRVKSDGYNQYIYTNCTKSGKTTATVYSPHKIGWHIWKSK